LAVLNLSRFVLVGQAPAKSTPAGSPPLLVGPTPKRLMELGGLELREYVFLFDRRNVLDRWTGKQGNGDSFPLAEARKKAALASMSDLVDRDIVFLGKSVAGAFGRGDVPYFERSKFGWGTKGSAVTFPHPSGVSHWWNEPSNHLKAKMFMGYLVEESRRRLSFGVPGLTPEVLRWMNS